MLTVLALAFVTDAARIVPEAKLRREFRYRDLSARNFAASVLGGGVGIWMALNGFGVWALVGQRVTGSLAHAILSSLASGWLPRPHFSPVEFRHLVEFGTPLVMAQLAAFANTRVSELALGLMAGPGAVAYFRTGRRGLELLVQSTLQPMYTAALSAMARLDGKPAVAGAYERLTGACAMVAAPSFCGAAVIAPDFVHLCFGPQWGPSGQVLALLALVVGAATLRYFVDPALIAVGRSRDVLRGNLLLLVGNACAATLTAPFGVAAVAAGQTAASYLTLPGLLAFLRRGVGVEPARALRGIAVPSLAAPAMALVLVGFRDIWLPDAAPIVRVSILVVLGALVYVLLLLLFGRTYLRRTLAEVRPLLPVQLRHLTAI